MRQPDVLPFYWSGQIQYSKLFRIRPFLLVASYVFLLFGIPIRYHYRKSEKAYGGITPATNWDILHITDGFRRSSNSMVIPQGGGAQERKRIKSQRCLKSDGSIPLRWWMIGRGSYSIMRTNEPCDEYHYKLYVLHDIQYHCRCIYCSHVEIVQFVWLTRMTYAIIDVISVTPDFNPC